MTEELALEESIPTWIYDMKFCHRGVHGEPTFFCGKKRKNAPGAAHFGGETAICPVLGSSG